jgi:hypothetical protein
MGTVCPKYKKKREGNKSDNYKGKTLSSCIYKVLLSIISNRLTEYTDKIIDDYQNGFRPNRGAMDDIHIIRQIIEKAYEHNTQTDILSIDFKHAFNSIYRYEMIKILHLQGISSKLMRSIRMTHEDSQAKVVIEKKKTKF